ncbi:DUF2721 domain-containing protein [Anaeromyxobacter sp. Fw109-5]|uniref:DUF2721 domain-containing protein n=1 Tax=Anaeromyxobacter sp. (strain Fw109-5) TaxID=404589 RepID=UPI0000ED75BA|nr:DUF2721 domain-containing protein [Anaeromyxobacter sp. Fw109-5]ABS26685.1 conserved hypothetical protein [Anaeromyxobacter sp. Fw109-5]
MEHALEHLAAAVTPAVMVSACGLIALGLDNQIARMSGRLRELAREFRDDDAPARRSVVARQVRVLELRHRLYSRAILLNYGALFSFVLTSLLWLGQAYVAIGPAAPMATFGLGVVLMAGMALYVMASIAQARRTVRAEAADILGRRPEGRVASPPDPARAGAR